MYDFSGYATKNDITCGDGRVIRKDAFKDNDGTRVPLVWQHIHNDPANVLGHADLENREDGVYAYCSFNDTELAKTAKNLVQHGDVTSMSIYANRLQQNGNNVVHGLIREVSLVLAGANPGATIDPLSIAHSDGTVSELDDEAIIKIGDEGKLFIAHGDDSKEDTSDDDTADQNEKTVQEVIDSMTDDQKNAMYYLVGKALGGSDDPSTDEDDVSHADTGKTLKEVVDSMSEEQKNVMYYLVGLALEDKEAKHDDLDDDISHDELGDNMHRNVFDETKTDQTETLSHDEMAQIFAEAPRYGSLKEAFLQHGIENLEILFPEANAVTPTPEMIKRDTSWVPEVWGATRKTPFARIKSVAADITEYEARARGYIKGNQKIEEIFSLLARTTSPQTVYKLQKLDRDDIIDITDLDVVAWMRAEMRTMLEEEIAAAILIEDGRPANDPSKIKTDNIRPIYTDDELYTIHQPVTIPSGATNSQISDILVETALLARKDYKGSGNPAFYASSDVITRMLLAKDQIGRRLYNNLNDLASALRVSKIVEVPILEGATRSYTDTSSGTSVVVTPKLLGLIVNLSDYTIGADKGGAVSMFDDFDLNYNKYEYLIETRCSGALIKPKSAIAIETTSDLPFEFGTRPGAYRASRPTPTTTEDDGE